ncbi:MAG: hypothetical protein IJW37_05675, partial [Lachnospiraceae bacterium]|nr:hypothetical protein [Lachnospiraceae bacterium]
MKFLNKLERKWGRYAIPNLMFYMIVLYVVGFVLELFAPGFYEKWLSLEVYYVLHGQVWRLVTFVLQPPTSSPLFLLIELYMYYSIGRSLESMWGAFRFNVYYFSGLLFQILASFLFYGITCAILGGGLLPITTMGVGSLYQVNRAMFLAYIVMVPNATFFMSFIIPIKAKWLGIIYGVLMGYEVIKYIQEGVVEGNLFAYGSAAAIVVSFANFLIF